MTFRRQLALLTAFYHALQFVSGIALYRNTNSPALLTYALDAIVSAPAALILALRIARHNRIDIIGIEEKWRFRSVAQPGQAGDHSWNGARPEQRSGGSASSLPRMRSFRPSRARPSFRRHFQTLGSLQLADLPAPGRPRGLTGRALKMIYIDGDVYPRRRMCKWRSGATAWPSDCPARSWRR